MFELPNAVAFVEDDEALRRANVQSLELAGFEVSGYASARQALSQIDPKFAGVVITDLRMPEVDGRMLFRQLREMDTDLPVIFITGHADIGEAVEAIHQGAYDYLAKPYSVERLISSTRRALNQRGLVLDNRRLLAAAGGTGAEGSLLGETPVMERLRAIVRQVAQTNVDVLVEGETGVGKELVARLIHRSSRRRSQPFVAIDLAALPEAAESELFGHEAGATNGALRRRIGRIESADRGTLFLDELESMPAPIQGKLLRVLEEREVTPLGGNEPRAVDLRIVAAAKGDLQVLIDRGSFRSDLFYRLDAVRIRIPPLRERRPDVPLLFARFLTDAAARFRRDLPKLTDAVRLRLLTHDWPGNVRELAHFAERVALGLDDLEPLAPVVETTSLPERIAAYEIQLIREALQSCAGDARVAVDLLGIPRKTFYDKVRKHRIDIRGYRAAR